MKETNRSYLRKGKKVAKEDQGRCCRSLKFAKELLRHTFFKTDFEREKKSLEEKVITKSWVCHCCQTIVRLALTVTGTPYVTKVYESGDYPENMNVDFVQDSKDIVQALFICVTLLGAILDIVTWRKRQFGLLIYPLEVIGLMLMAAMPFDFGFFRSTMLMMTACYFYQMYAVNTKTHAAVGIISYLAI